MDESKNRLKIIKTEITRKTLCQIMGPGPGHHQKQIVMETGRHKPGAMFVDFLKSVSGDEGRLRLGKFCIRPLHRKNAGKLRRSRLLSLKPQGVA